jgi:cytochrome c oxidase subunit 2
MRTSSIGLLYSLALMAGAAVLGRTAFAAEGRAENWQIGFQPAATPIAEQMHGFHNLVLVIITLITLFVLALLLWVIIRYNAKANPEPSRVSHNTTIEIIWTVLPVLILLVIAVPSFRLLYAQYDFPKPDLTIKVTGRQWYWNYAYPDQGNFAFDSILVEEASLKPGQPYLLTVDNEVVVPVNKVVHLLVTSDDVIHNWAMPAFGSKIDALKGRNTATWFKVTRPGVYYGQCSELCGARHAYMPITVRVVSDEEFAAWVGRARQQFASSMPEAEQAKLKAELAQVEQATGGKLAAAEAK